MCERSMGATPLVRPTRRGQAPTSQCRGKDFMSDSRDLVDANVVAFHFDQPREATVTHVPTLADDGIERAWRNVFVEHRFLPEDVTAIACEWKPTDADQQFMSRKFPNLKDVSFNFERPEPDGWPAAFERAQAARVEAMRNHPELAGDPPVSQGSTPEPDNARPPDFVLLPLLRMGPNPPPDSAYRTLIPNVLYLCAANVGWTPRKTLAMQWVLQSFLNNEFTFDGVLDEGFANLARALQIEDMSSEDGSEHLLVFKGKTPLHMPAAAVALPGFHQRLSQILGGDRFLVGITCHDKLHVMRADSTRTWYMREIVFENDHLEEDLAPTLLLLERDGMQIVEQKGTPSGREPWAL